MSPDKNIKSAMLSNRWFMCFSLFIEIKDKMQLAMNKIMARAVVSSIRVLSCILDTLMEVSTTKHKPSRVAEVLSMWGDLFSAM